MQASQGHHRPEAAIPPGWQIDPFNITRFDRDRAELEALFLFCVAVAGKKATMTAAKMRDLLAGCGREGSPFERVWAMLADGSLRSEMERVRLGKYALLERSWREAIERRVDLANDPPEVIAAIHGCAEKTSRFFCLHSRRDARVAVIDTHVLKYLRSIGVDRVPKAVPTGRDYLRLEAILLAEADRVGLAKADFDLQIWSWYASGKQGAPVFEARTA